MKVYNSHGTPDNLKLQFTYVRLLFADVYNEYCAHPQSIRSTALAQVHAVCFWLRIFDTTVFVDTPVIFCQPLAVGPALLIRHCHIWAHLLYCHRVLITSSERVVVLGFFLHTCLSLWFLGHISGGPVLLQNRRI